MELSSTVLQFVQERKKELVIGFTSVTAGVAILIAYFQAGPDAQSYAQAQRAFLQWESAPQDDGLYAHLKEAVRNTPSIGAKYEAAIAQQLLNTARASDALAMAMRSIRRVEDEVPFHSQYARTTLLIEQGEYQRALQEAVALKVRLGDKPATALLQAHNLLRIACLQQALHNRPGEKVAWEELEAFLKTAEGSPLAALTAGSVGFSQYIAERKKS